MPFAWCVALRPASSSSDFLVLTTGAGFGTTAGAVGAGSGSLATGGTGGAGFAIGGT